MSGNRTLRHIKQTGELSLDFEKISASTSPLTSGHLTSQIAIPLIIMCGAQLIKRPTKLWLTPKMKARITAVFSNLSKETIRKTCRRFQNCLEVVVFAIGDFFE